jgi:hypothetical protein
MAGGHVDRVRSPAARKSVCLIQYARMDDEPAKKEGSTMFLIGVAIILALVVGLLLSLSNIAKQQRMYAISSFKECKDAGYPIMESYPEQCATSDGRSFLNDAQPATNLQVSTSTTDFSTSSPQAI